MTDSISTQMYQAAVTQSEQAARAQRRHDNPWRCMSCSYASLAAATDADGLCPWCRAEQSKANHLNSALRLLGGSSR